MTLIISPQQDRKWERCSSHLKIIERSYVLLQAEAVAIQQSRVESLQAEGREAEANRQASLLSKMTVGVPSVSSFSRA